MQAEGVFQQVFVLLILQISRHALPASKLGKILMCFRSIWTISANTLTDFRGPSFLHNCP